MGHFRIRKSPLMAHVAYFYEEALIRFDPLIQIAAQL